MIEKVLACCVMQNSKSNKIWGIAAINLDTWTFITFHGAINQQLKFTKLELGGSWTKSYPPNIRNQYVVNESEGLIRKKLRKGYTEVEAKSLNEICKDLQKSVEDVIMFATLSL
jgi:hypothetical protein